MAEEDRALLAGLHRLCTEFEVFAEECLKIKGKGGKIEPFILNRAQRHIHERLEKQLRETGKVRALLLKGRQQGGCLDPDTRVLTADLRWVRIADAQIGDRLVACDEDVPGGKGTPRHMRTSIVEHKWTTYKPAYRVTLDDGRFVVCSADHRWLSKKSQAMPAWRSIAPRENDNTGRSGLVVGDMLRSITEEWNESSLEDYWFGGMIDGEGSLDGQKTSGGSMLAVSQRAGAVLDRMEAHCVARGYGHYIISDDGPRRTKLGLQAVHAVNISSMRTLFRALGLSRPSRFIGYEWWDGRRMPDNGWHKIVSIEPVGEMELVDIQTSTGTYVARGIVSHNSTYIGGRFYWKTTTQTGQSAFIMAHEQKATDNLFAMVNRFHDHNPMAPSTGNSNAKELVFDNLDGGYKLATAGTEEVGRSNTSQFLHGSEVAFWKSASSHMGSLGNTVADIDGTEIVLESTANGIGNTFHQMWQKAQRGEGEYIAIFVPWFWQDEYNAQIKPGFIESLSDEDLEYMQTYGLSPEQMQWRANKIATYDEGDDWRFDQEYPACEELAFQIPRGKPLIKVNWVMAAAKSAYMDLIGPLVIGCDPASDGEESDTTAIVWRRGRVALKVERHEKADEMQIAGILAGYWTKGDNKGRKPDAIFVDKGGIGSGIVSRLKELNIPVVGVLFGESAIDSDTYGNRRAEMHYTMRDWFNDQPCRIPNDPGLISALVASQPKTTSNDRKLLEPKKDVKKRLGRSPDEADALALTFAAPVEKRTESRLPEVSQGHRAGTRSGY